MLTTCTPPDSMARMLRIADAGARGKRLKWCMEIDIVRKQLPARQCGNMSQELLRLSANPFAEPVKGLAF